MEFYDAAAQAMFETVMHRTIPSADTLKPVLLSMDQEYGCDEMHQVVVGFKLVIVKCSQPKCGYQERFVQS